MLDCIYQHRKVRENNKVLGKSHKLCFGNIEYDIPVNHPRERRYSAGGWFTGSLDPATRLEFISKQVWAEHGQGGCHPWKVYKVSSGNHLGDYQFWKSKKV